VVSSGLTRNNPFINKGSSVGKSLVPRDERSMAVISDRFSDSRRLPLVFPSVRRKLKALISVIEAISSGRISTPFDAVNQAVPTRSTNHKRRKAPVVLQTYSRGSTIPQGFVGLTMGVHSGRSFERVSITEHKVGRKFGEFVGTRKYVRHKVNKTRQGRRRKF
jgi:ribosomal protein S19